MWWMKLVLAICCTWPLVSLLIYLTLPFSRVTHQVLQFNIQYCNTQKPALQIGSHKSYIPVKTWEFDKKTVTGHYSTRSRPAEITHYPRYAIYFRIRSYGKPLVWRIIQRLKYNIQNPPWLHEIRKALARHLGWRWVCIISVLIFKCVHLLYT